MPEQQLELPLPPSLSQILEPLIYAADYMAGDVLVLVSHEVDYAETLVKLAEALGLDGFDSPAQIVRALALRLS